MKTKLTIFLYKQGVDLAQRKKILKSNNNLLQKKIEPGFLFYKTPQRSVPEWLQAFFGQREASSDELSILETKIVQAVYLVEVNVGTDSDKRVFAITFGYGRYLLNLANIEHRFGLLVTLNVLDKEKIRLVDTHELSWFDKSQRVQMGKLSDISAFNVNVNQDLLQTLMGYTAPSEKELGECVLGRDSLTISVDCTCCNIIPILEKCYKLYTSTRYQNDFSWIDQIQSLQEESLINELDEQLLKHLKSDHWSEVAFIAPEILSWENVSSIRYGKSKKDYNDFDLETALSSCKTVSIETLKQRRVEVRRNNEPPLHWSIYQCLNVEIRYGKKDNLYVLNHGVWYEFNSNYVSRIENAYKNVPISSISMHNRCDQDINEKAYNENEATQQSDHMWCLCDCRTIRPEGASSKIELCDLFVPPNEGGQDFDTSDKHYSFIHVKLSSSSSLLSHLFNQGMVSALCFLRPEFRHQLNSWKIFKDAGINVPDGVDDFRPSDYNIIFAIESSGCSQDGIRPKIPFFSKISFDNVYATLQRFGYHIYLKRIIGVNKN
jgi:uncharacterized protein (TIGR04141 family)